MTNEELTTLNSMLCNYGHSVPPHKLHYMFRSPKHTVVSWADTLSGLRKAVDQFHDYNAYIQLNPSTVPTFRCTAADVAMWNWFVLDLDPKEETFDPLAALEAYQSYFRNYFGEAKLDGHIIHSGRGAQLWVPLVSPSLDDFISLPLSRGSISEGDKMEYPETISITIRKAARRAMSYWLGKAFNDLGAQHGCVLDTSTSDLPRFMRMPFTTNTKTGATATVVQRYTGKANSVLWHKLIHYAPYYLWTPRPMTPAAGGSGWQTVYSRLNWTAREFLVRGWEEPGRHKAAFATIKELRDVGLSHEKIRDAVMRGASLCTPADEKFGRDIERMLDTNLDTEDECPGEVQSSGDTSTKVTS